MRDIRGYRVWKFTEREMFFGKSKELAKAYAKEMLGAERVKEIEEKGWLAELSDEEFNKGKLHIIEESGMITEKTEMISYPKALAEHASSGDPAGHFMTMEY